MESQKERKYTMSKITAKIYSFVRKYRVWLIAYMALSVLNAFINVAMGHLMNTAITSAVELKNTLITNLIQLSVIMVLGMFAAYTTTYLYGLFKARVMQDIKTYAIDRLQKLPLKFIENNHTGDIISRYTKDLNTIQNFIGEDLFKTLGLLCATVITAIYLIGISWKLYLFSVIIIPPVMFLSKKVLGPMNEYFEKSSELVGKANSIAQDSYGGIFIIKAFNLEKLFQSRFSELIIKNSQYETKAIHRLKWNPPFNIILGSMPFTLCLILGAYLAINKEISPGQLPAFVFLLNFTVWPVSSLPGNISNMISSMGTAGRFFEILDTPAEREDGKEFDVKEAEICIGFKNASYSYDGKRNVVDDISFEIKTGSKTAIVGQSGCGKTTILKLISGFYECQGGDMELFEHNVKDWSLNGIRSKISYVSQDTYLFPTSVMENIAYGRPGASREEITEAAITANAHEFIMELPEGYNTLVGERGIKLSGGQKQRISLSRAVLRNAPVILLDEPTSALDTLSEAQVQDALNKVMEDKTAIIVAHRLSTIKDVDEIFVMDKGRIVERGSHEELKAKDSIYSRLYSKQLENNNSMPMEICNE